MLALLLGIFAVLLLLGVPISFSMAIASAVFFVVGDYSLIQFAQRIVAGVDSFTILAIPFFMLSGAIMGKGGVSKKILRFVNVLVGRIRGSLAVTGIISCALFGAICGSAPATAVAVGGIIMPEMLEKNYKRSFTATCFGVAGGLGLLIPPSLVMVFIGSTGNISIGDLFMAGIVPGIVLCVLLCIWAIWQSRKFNYGITENMRMERPSGKEVWQAFVGAILPLTTPLFILGSIMSGIATPTESAVISVVWSIFLSMVIYREVSPKEMVKIFLEAASGTAGVTGVMAAASAFGYALAIEKVPEAISRFFLQYVTNQWTFFAIVFVIIFLLGCVTEAVSIIVICLPIFLPIATSMGIDPLHFGIFMTMALTMGTITPPVGLSMISAGKVIGVRIEETFPEILHCILIETVMCVLIVLFPIMCTWVYSL
ncbi:MAG: TRAP transporter large permease [Firmicutes bacterium]|nr:TRAP transporter large permease [Bacillota bacterium]